MWSNSARMPAKRKTALALEKDQLWKAVDGYVQIVEVGKRLIHYRMFKGQSGQATPIKMTTINTVQDYLMSNRAVLVKERK